MSGVRQVSQGLALPAPARVGSAEVFFFAGEGRAINACDTVVIIKMFRITLPKVLVGFNTVRKYNLHFSM